MAAQITITDLIADYLRHARSYYVKGGEPTSEVHAIKLALSFVERLFGETSAFEFSPRRLKEVREAMIAHEITRRRKVTDAAGNVTWETHVVRKGLARKCVNKLIGRVRRMFAWAVEEILPVEVHNAILRVKGLKRGKSQARETGRVKPVPDEHITAIAVPKTVRAMIDIQKLAGCRPQDVVQLRRADIDMTGPVWEYRPRQYKTEHHNDEEREELERIVYLGPRCQAILGPLLVDDPAAYVFTPQRSTASHYTVASYRQAIRRAVRGAKIPIWSPNRLRHNRLTELRKTFGLEASRVCGGHREVATTQIYAEQDRDLAREVMGKVG